MNPFADRWICERCGKITQKDALLKTANPFLESESIYGCPHCCGVGGVGSFVPCCDQEGCDTEAIRGLPVKGGCRRICENHYKSHCGEESGDRK